MTERIEKIRPLLDELDADAVVVVALRDVDREGSTTNSIIAASRDDSLSSQIVGPLGEKIISILDDAFRHAGLVTDFVRRD